MWYLVYIRSIPFAYGEHAQYLRGQEMHPDYAEKDATQQ